MTTSTFFKRTLILFVFLSFSFIRKENIDLNHKLVLFEGSDWCVNCIRLDKNILSDPYFDHFLKRNAIELERIDFPQRKKLDETTKNYNAEMAEKYSFKGIFPTIILVEAASNEFVPLEYHDQSLDDFIAQIKSNISH